ncbi:phage integrase [Paraburkholderia sp. RL17-347-BIC-D]|uniref:phage integrase n=1 Tax=Paraburkholderia sp. RL17-347-BIC-D TaxID=3031632 RepID=UPI0038B81BB6
MQIRLGALTLILKHSYQRGNTFYFQRPIPRDLQQHYGKKLVKINLKTSDVALAARKIDALNAQFEEDWRMLRADPDSSLKATRKHAEAFLASWGIVPGTARDEITETALQLLHDHLEKKREAHADGDEKVYREASGSEYLTMVESTAMQMAAGTLRDSLSDALELYISHHKKRDETNFTSFSRAAFKTLTDAIGDKPVDKTTREDAHKYVQSQLDAGLKTGTVRRRLSTINAVFASYIKEKELTRTNPFESLQIAGEGKDTKERVPFDPAELVAVQAKCREADDDIRWLIAMLSDTGARIAEVAGLTLREIVLDAPVPHIVIKEQPWRTVKGGAGSSSEREVPLLGHSLWAAKRVKEMAKANQKFAFPRYTSDEEGCNADGASATVNGWLRANKWDHTAHEFRHTMADRLREVACPTEVRHSIGGWAIKGEAAGYGKGYSLRIKRQWLEKVVACGEIRGHAGDTEV